MPAALIVAIGKGGTLPYQTVNVRSPDGITTEGMNGVSTVVVYEKKKEIGAGRLGSLRCYLKQCRECP
jgi:hypothetical protein